MGIGNIFDKFLENIFGILYQTDSFLISHKLF